MINLRGGIFVGVVCGGSLSCGLVSISTRIVGVGVRSVFSSKNAVPPDEDKQAESESMNANPKVVFLIKGLDIARQRCLQKKKILFMARALTLQIQKVKVA